jgi:hypothetical protein
MYSVVEHFKSETEAKDIPLKCHFKIKAKEKNNFVNCSRIRRILFYKRFVHLFSTEACQNVVKFSLFTKTTSLLL